MLSPEEREKSRADTLVKKDLSDGLWVFGYGSLMWNPGFPYLEIQTGILEGYHRDFCIWAEFSRGTPEKPGLSLGLKPGGSSTGYLSKISPELIEKTTIELWEREQKTGILMPVWATVKTQSSEIEALVFVVDTSHEKFADLTPEEAAPHILEAKGSAGTCFDYLDSTIKKLNDIGVTDDKLNLIMDQVLKLKAQKGS